MATDYDAPRKTDDELAEDSLEELKAQRATKAASSVDVDEVELAENLELPGADRGNGHGVPAAKRKGSGVAGFLHAGERCELYAGGSGA